MKFSTRSDIEAPIDHVFNELSDFRNFERLAMRRGAKVQRIDRQDVIGPGMSWSAEFPFRGKTRQVQIDLEDYEKPTQLSFAGKSQGLTGYCEIELIELSPKKTRMRLSLDIKPQTLSARLMVQSMKLAKGTIDKRFEARIADYAKDVGTRYSKMA